VQNVPVGKIVKQTVVADEGFYLAECDLEQAETRDTAYITGDTNLLRALTQTATSIVTTLRHSSDYPTSQSLIQLAERFLTSLSEILAKELITVPTTTWDLMCC
jgi:hypothetical protein